MNMDSELLALLRQICWVNHRITIDEYNKIVAIIGRRQTSEIELAKGRSINYWQKTPAEQWEEDKRLGLVDWDGK